MYSTVIYWIGERCTGDQYVSMNADHVCFNCDVPKEMRDEECMSVQDLMYCTCMNRDFLSSWVLVLYCTIYYIVLLIVLLGEIHVFRRTDNVLIALLCSTVPIYWSNSALGTNSHRCLIFIHMRLCSRTGFWYSYMMIILLTIYCVGVITAFLKNNTYCSLLSN